MREDHISAGQPGKRSHLGSWSMASAEGRLLCTTVKCRNQKLTHAKSGTLCVYTWLLWVDSKRTLFIVIRFIDRTEARKCISASFFSSHAFIHWSCPGLDTEYADWSQRLQHWHERKKRVQTMSIVSHPLILFCCVISLYWGPPDPSWVFKSLLRAV